MVAGGTAAVVVLSLLIRFSLRAKNRKPGTGSLAWALLFMQVGEIPPPTPQEETEQENSQRKNRGAGDDVDRQN